MTSPSLNLNYDPNYVAMLAALYLDLACLYDVAAHLQGLYDDSVNHAEIGSDAVKLAHGTRKVTHRGDHD